MRPDLDNPRHVVHPLAELAAELAGRDLLHVLEHQLAKPTLGHPMYAAGRRLCRMRWLESELAVLRWELEVAA